VPWLADAEELHARSWPRSRSTSASASHQLLAQALGGKVDRARRWGVGVQHYDIVEPLPCMDPPLTRFALLASHQDQVVDVPPDARAIAPSTSGTAVAGLRSVNGRGRSKRIPSSCRRSPITCSRAGSN
jgi:hypothetical protein